MRLQWNGTDTLLIRRDPMGGKEAIAPGGRFEVEDDRRALYFLAYNRGKLVRATEPQEQVVVEDVALDAEETHTTVLTAKKKGRRS